MSVMGRFCLALLLAFCAVACSEEPGSFIEAEPFGRGPYLVGSTNMEIAPEHAGIGDDAMHKYLLGHRSESGEMRFVTDLLKHPESAWITDISVPEDEAVYGPASGISFPVVTFVAYPSAGSDAPRTYSFPYHGAAYGSFEDMLDSGEKPVFSDPLERYPLILISHGSEAHGIYDVKHAHDLASHGYIVAVISYGENRMQQVNSPNFHLSYLRPFITKAVLDSLLASDTFGPRIDTANIGVTGFSFGGFTALALAGGPFQGNAASVSDGRITAAVVAAPWVGGNYGGRDFYAFGPYNSELSRVDIPVISFFGSNDDVTRASFILPAMKELSGPTYVIELVDQRHDLEPGSWEDRNSWEQLFFSAYLKHDPDSLKLLRSVRSMQGGNEDVQLFDYQDSPGQEE